MHDMKTVLAALRSYAEPRSSLPHAMAETELEEMPDDVAIEAWKTCQSPADMLAYLAVSRGLAIAQGALSSLQAVFPFQVHINTKDHPFYEYSFQYSAAGLYGPMADWLRENAPVPQPFKDTRARLAHLREEEEAP